MRALHTIAALAMLGAAAPSVRLVGDTMFAARLRPRRYPSGRFYRPQVGGYVSRPQRRAVERAERFAHLRGTGMSRSDARFMVACATHNRAVCRALDRDAVKRAASRTRPVSKPDPRTAPFGALRGDVRA